jgi:hypothetical protein
MSVFICWSGTRSHRIALAIKALLHRTVPALERERAVFVSDGIAKGETWFSSIVTELNRAKAGIVCLTGENLHSPWMHFEAGALARGLSARPAAGVRRGTHGDRLFTVIHGITGADTDGPLSAYQATSTTRRDMSALVQTLRALFDDTAKAEQEIRDDAWCRFEQALRHAVVPARALVPELGKMFQRKTFNEPIQQCADQAWLARYQGARITRETLSPHADRIRSACPDHERGLFDMLLRELDGYAMAIEALLLTHEKFKLGSNGELEIDANILKCCEDRRLAIRSLAGRLLHPPDDPLLPEAVWFMDAGTDEERKTIIHGLEGRIRREREETYEDVYKGAEQQSLVDTAIEKLTRELLEAAREREAAAAEDREVCKRATAPGRGKAGAQAAERQPAAREMPMRLLRFRESSWDLDRIYYYLLVQYFGVHALRWEASGTSVAPRSRAAGSGAGDADADERSPLSHDVFCAARDVEMEIERYRARTKGGSLTPLTYALVALATLKPSRLPSEDAKTSVAAAVSLVEEDLADVLKTDPDHPIARLLGEILDLTQAERRARYGDPRLTPAD